MPPAAAHALPAALEQALQQLQPLPGPLPAPITAGEHLARIEALRRRMATSRLDAVLVGAGASLRYLTGLHVAPTERAVALLLPLGGEPHLLCPRFELGSMAAGLAIGAALLPWDEHENPVRILQTALPHGMRLGLDPETPFRISRALADSRPDLHLVDAAPVLDAGRRVKSEAELRLIDRAMRITEAVHALLPPLLQPGLRASGLKRFIDAAHRALGAADGASFCAVQFDRATAFPHGLPGDQILQPDALVLVDTGCVLDGYNADMTRCWRIGAGDAEQERIWQVERDAQQAAFDAVRPGVAAEAVDAAARRVLEAHGLGPDYRLPGLPHRTGHGIGLQIHEPEYIVRGNRTPLEPGMCFSIEPMIVIPDRFGVRLEDCVVVTETGARWFTEPATDWRGNA